MFIAFVAINTVWLRVAHQFAGVPWNAHSLFESFLVQAGYSILWTLIALGLMVLAHRRQTRALWMGGVALLGATVLKLFLIDLSNRGGSERIVVFIAVGVLMLVVGYFAPIPPPSAAPQDERTQGGAAMIRSLTIVLLWLGTLACAQAAEAPAPSEFSWRATLAVPAGASVARVSLPAQALLRLQSREAHDIRVFNAEGEAVAFALVAPPPAALAVAQTRAYPAYPLFATSHTKQAAKGAVQVQLEQSQGGSAVWVRFDDAGKAANTPDASATRLPSVLFDTRRRRPASAP